MAQSSKDFKARSTLGKDSLIYMKSFYFPATWKDAVLKLERQYQTLNVDALTLKTVNFFS